MALALLLLGMPLGAVDAPGTPAAPIDQAGGDAGPIWFSSGLNVPAVPETGASRKAPEVSTVATLGGVAVVTGRGSEHVATPVAAALSVGTPLYLSHCAFLC